MGTKSNYLTIIGTLLTATYIILIISISYCKFFQGGNELSAHHTIMLRFKEPNNISIDIVASQDVYIPPEEQKSINKNTTHGSTSVGNHPIKLNPYNTTSTEITLKHPTSSRSKIAKQTPYMLALHIAEQLTMSTAHFVEFMNLVHQWNLTGVEPVVYGSRMNALRSMHTENIDHSVYYHQILNTSLMRYKLNKCLTGRSDGLASNSSQQLFVPLNVFLRQSVRKVTLVYFSKHVNVLGTKLHTAADVLLTNKSKSGLPVIECTDILRESGISCKVEELLNQELIIDEVNYVNNFTVVQAFCIVEMNVSLVKIREDILTFIYRNKFKTIGASIVFISWQGRFTRTFTDMNTLYHCRLPSSQIEPSQQVLATSDKFLKSLGLKKQSYIAIHIRFEKLFEAAFEHQKDPRHFLNCCMLKLNALLKQMKRIHNLTSEGSTLLLHDYVHYGTDVCQHDGGWRSRPVCVNESQYLLSLLNESRASEFDPVKFDAPQNSGFVSLVERVALTGGHSLIVLGGGSFQVSITGHYTDRLKREQVKSGAVYSICTAHESVHNVELGEIKKCT